MVETAFFAVEVAGAQIQGVGAGVIAFDGDSFVVEERQRVAAGCEIVFAGDAVEECGAGEVDGGAAAVFVEEGKVETGAALSVFASEVVEGCCAFEIDGCSLAYIVHDSEAFAALWMSVVAGFFEELCGAAGVFLWALAGLVEHSKQGAAEVVAEVTALLVMLGCAGEVFGDSLAAFVDESEHCAAGSEFGVATLGEDFGELFVVGGASELEIEVGGEDVAGGLIVADAGAEIEGDCVRGIEGWVDCVVLDFGQALFEHVGVCVAGAWFAEAAGFLVKVGGLFHVFWDVCAVVMHGCKGVAAEGGVEGAGFLVEFVGAGKVLVDAAGGDEQGR